MIKYIYSYQGQQLFLIIQFIDMYSCNNSGGSSLSIPTGSNRSAVVTPNQKKKTAIDSKEIPIFRKIPIKKKREVSKLCGDKK